MHVGFCQAALGYGGGAANKQLTRCLALLMSTSAARHLLAAVAGGAVGFGLCVLASRYLRSCDVASVCLPPAQPHSLPTHAADRAGPTGGPSCGHHSGTGDGGAHSVADYEGDEVLEEQFTRNVQFFGSEGQRRAARAFVVVIGLGVRPAQTTMRRERSLQSV